MTLKNFTKYLAIFIAIIGIGGATVAVTSAQVVEETPNAEVQEGERGQRGDREKPEWFDKDLFKQTMAAELGTTVEELEAAKEGDTPVTEALGVTREEIKAAKQVAKQAVIDQAVANGDLTAEEAEELSNRQGRRGGNGPRGQRGGGDAPQAETNA